MKFKVNLDVSVAIDGEVKLLLAGEVFQAKKDYERFLERPYIFEVVEETKEEQVEVKETKKPKTKKESK